MKEALRSDSVEKPEYADELEKLESADESEKIFNKKGLSGLTNTACSGYISLLNVCTTVFVDRAIIKEVCQPV